MRKVLMITYNFPPMGGVAVQRTLKFVKYLANWGWQPIVLTVHKPIWFLDDQRLVSQIPPGVKVIRTKAINPVGIVNAFDKAESQGVRNRSGLKRIFSRLIGLLARIAVLPIRYVLCIPDLNVGWLPFAFIAAMRIIYHDQVDVVYISGDPFSSFLLGPFLKLFTKKPYVLDFRDEWTGFWIHTDGLSRGKSDKRIIIEKILERFVVKFADRVVSVTDSIIANYRRKYRWYNSNKFVCITNGFDKEDFNIVKSKPLKKDKLIFTFLGSIFEFTSPEPFLQALSSLFDERPGFRDLIKVQFIGNISRSMVTLFNPNEAIECIGYMPHSEALNYLYQSHVLLLFLKDIPGAGRILTGKIFEYIAVRKLIFAVCPEGEVSKLINRYKRGVWCNPNDVQGIKERILFLKAYHDQHGDLKGLYNDEILWQYERKKLTKDLTNIFDSVIGKDEKN